MIVKKENFFKKLIKMKIQKEIYIEKKVVFIEIIKHQKIY